MISPVQKQYFVSDYDWTSMPDSFTPGEEALSNLSMLNPPEHSCRAISKKNLSQLTMQLHSDPDDVEDEDYCILEVWKYDPGLFASAEIDNVAITDDADLFSLYVSLNHTADDIRVQDELNDLVEAYWNDRRD